MAKCIHCSKEWKTKDGSDPSICRKCESIGHDPAVAIRQNCILCREGTLHHCLVVINNNDICLDYARHLYKGDWYCDKHIKQAKFASLEFKPLILDSDMTFEKQKEITLRIDSSLGLSKKDLGI